MKVILFVKNYSLEKAQNSHYNSKSFYTYRHSKNEITKTWNSFITQLSQIFIVLLSQVCNIILFMWTIAMGGFYDSCFGLIPREDYKQSYFGTCHRCISYLQECYIYICISICGLSENADQHNDPMKPTKVL